MKRTCKADMRDAKIPRLPQELWRPFVDIHCHCLPAVDDGPETMDAAIRLCRALVADGIRYVIATPHQLGRFEGRNRAQTVRTAVRRLNEMLQDEAIPLVVLAGGEVRADERICRLLETDTILTLADSGKYLLLELPHEVFVNIAPLLKQLRSKDVQTIIAHPEKNAPLLRHPWALEKWLALGTMLQISAGNLLGDIGTSVQKAAWQLLASTPTVLVATDAHDADICRPRMRDAFAAISSRFGDAFARRVCIENPLPIMHGQELAPKERVGTLACNRAARCGSPLRLGARRQEVNR